MVGRDVDGLVDEAVPVIGDIVFHVAVAALSDFNFGAVGVGWSKIGYP